MVGPETTITSIVSVAFGAIVSSIWYSYVNSREKIDFEIWKTKKDVLEKRLSDFYYPLNALFTRDDLIWKKVFIDLRDDEHAERSAWATRLTPEDRRLLRDRIETDVILKTHQEAVEILKLRMHLADADEHLRGLLFAYLRHVDTYKAIRDAGFANIDPLAVGEAYPTGLGEAVHAKLIAVEAEYRSLMKERGLASL